ncbi:NUDIX domain-containing protein [Actinomadura rayongensis]|uniref:NUDIX domain-containing protein n=1 Tax=Actinomadura rayongensis TaxID=1429076 RepID=A0A6I4WDU3_9ACTN|nr:NUDIX hydrolase [Actinomadura rayongensis]MXQ67000.1 NUDIX domain-containing protein [Actinomadura rayongensis]
MSDVRRLGGRVVYENAWMSVREDEIERPDGSRGVYGVIDKPDFVVVLPFENGGFHLVEEYRYPVERRSWNFPQGSLPGRRAGDPEEVARRELAEETGLRAATLTRLGRLDAAHGMSSQRYAVFVATDLTAGEHAREPEEQDMRQQWFPEADVRRMIRDGVITDDSSVAAYALYVLSTDET